MPLALMQVVPLFFGVALAARHPMHLVLTTAGGGELWVGSIQAAGDVDFLRKNGISALVACASNVPVARSAGLKHLGTYDGTGAVTGDVKWFRLLALMDMVGQELRAAGRVLFSCRNGAHRSATMVALVLCFLTGEPPAVVMAHVTRIREMCDFDSLHPDRKNFNRPIVTPAQWLETKEADLRAAHDALEPGEKCMLNMVMTPDEFERFALANGASIPDRGSLCQTFSFE